MHSLSPDYLAKLRFDAQQLATLRAYKEFEERVGTLSRGRGAKGDRVRTEILKRHLPFSISEIEEACPGVSRDMVRLVLRAMKTEGLIAPTGKGRGAKWQQTGLQAGTEERAGKSVVNNTAPVNIKKPAI